MKRPSGEARFIHSLRHPRIKGFSWVSPQDELDNRIYREVLEDGCSILSFTGDSTSPEFTYSAGLYLNFEHPEVLLMGLHPQTARAIVMKIRDDAIKGVILTSQSVRHDLFSDGRPVRFRAVEQDCYLDYLGRNCNLYFSLFMASAVGDFGFPVLQAIWPDKQGFFPDDPRCDERFVAIHELVEEPFVDEP